jgi:hypothetical protein
VPEKRKTKFQSQWKAYLEAKIKESKGYNRQNKNKKIMAAVYKVEIVSHWINYTPKDLEEIIKKALNKEVRNVVCVEVERN